jgi:hypothetical protein
MKLKSPKNFRFKDVRIYVTCKFLEYPGDGTVRCIRPDGPDWDAGERNENYHVCDYWKLKE